jgi:uncharacterized protein DUF3485
MNRQSRCLLAVALVLMGLTAAYLGTLKGRQTLGRPAVKVINEPLYGDATIQSYGDARVGTQTNVLFVAATNTVYLPLTVLDYESKPVPVPKLVWDWLPKDTTYGQRLYTAPDHFAVSTTVVLMGSDRTSIHQPEYCLTGTGWVLDPPVKASVPMERPRRYELPITKITSTRLEKNQMGATMKLRSVYVYWFVADHQMTADHHQRMWWLARDLIRHGVLQRWAYISYFAVCEPGREDATFERMKQFIAASAPEFQLVPDPATGATAMAWRKPADDEFR